MRFRCQHHPYAGGVIEIQSVETPSVISFVVLQMASGEYNITHLYIMPLNPPLRRGVFEKSHARGVLNHDALIVS